MASLFYTPALRVRLNDIADKLVLYGADVNATSRAGRTPLLLAIDRGNESFVQLLLENGADADKSSNAGETPLLLAIAQNQTGIVNRLLNYRADPSKSGQGGVPLHAAIRESSSWSGRKVAKNMALTLTRAARKELHYRWVLQNGNVQIAEQLAKNGANVNITDSIGETLLHKAAARGQLGFANVIVANGANVNAKDQFNETPLHEAAAKGKLDVVKMLLSNGAKLNARTQKDWTALHSAARFGQPKNGGLFNPAWLEQIVVE